MYFLCTLSNGEYYCHSVHRCFADVIVEIKSQCFSPVSLWYIFSDLSSPTTAKLVDGKILVE